MGSSKAQWEGVYIKGYTFWTSMDGWEEKSNVLKRSHIEAVLKACKEVREEWMKEGGEDEDEYNMTGFACIGAPPG